MIFPYFCLITVFLSGSLAYADDQSSVSPEIQKKLDAIEQAEERIHQQLTPTAPKELPATLEEQLLEKVEKGAPVTARTNPCDSLPPEEQAFANNLGPAHKKVFCSKFSSNARKIAMRMVGKHDSKGNIITPMLAVDIVATEHDIVVPFIEIESLMEERESTSPQSQKESR